MISTIKNNTTLQNTQSNKIEKQLHQNKLSNKWQQLPLQPFERFKCYKCNIMMQQQRQQNNCSMQKSCCQLCYGTGQISSNDPMVQLFNDFFNAKLSKISESIMGGQVNRFSQNNNADADDDDCVRSQQNNMRNISFQQSSQYQRKSSLKNSFQNNMFSRPFLKKQNLPSKIFQRKTGVSEPFAMQVEGQFEQIKQEQNEETKNCKCCNSLIDDCYWSCQTCDSNSKQYWLCKECYDGQLYSHTPDHALVLSFFSATSNKFKEEDSKVKSLSSSSNIICESQLRHQQSSKFQQRQREQSALSFSDNSGSYKKQIQRNCSNSSSSDYESSLKCSRQMVPPFCGATGTQRLKALPSAENIQEMKMNHHSQQNMSSNMSLFSSSSSIGRQQQQHYSHESSSLKQQQQQHYSQESSLRQQQQQQFSHEQSSSLRQQEKQFSHESSSLRHQQKQHSQESSLRHQQQQYSQESSSLRHQQKQYSQQSSLRQQQRHQQQQQYTQQSSLRQQQQHYSQSQSQSQQNYNFSSKKEQKGELFSSFASQNTREMKFPKLAENDKFKTFNQNENNFMSQNFQSNQTQSIQLQKSEKSLQSQHSLTRQSFDPCESTSFTCNPVYNPELRGFDQQSRRSPPQSQSQSHHLRQSSHQQNRSSNNLCDEYIFKNCVCDMCGNEQIKNVKFHCRDCQDFDMCKQCYWSRRDDHIHTSFQRQDGQDFRFKEFLQKQKVIQKMFQLNRRKFTSAINKNNQRNSISMSVIMNEIGAGVGVGLDQQNNINTTQSGSNSSRYHHQQQQQQHHETSFNNCSSNSARITINGNGLMNKRCTNNISTHTGRSRVTTASSSNNFFRNSSTAAMMNTMLLGMNRMSRFH